MIQKLKNIGWTGAILSFLALSIIIVVLLVQYGTGFIENHQDLLGYINDSIIFIILLLFILSLVPRIRNFTGPSIAFMATIWIILFWLNCLTITYGLLGIVGVIIGFVLAGVGIFGIATFALFFTGQWIGALMLLLTLAIMFGVRALGLWIASKHRNTAVVSEIDKNSLERQGVKDNKIHYKSGVFVLTRKLSSGRDQFVTFKYRDHNAQLVMPGFHLAIFNELQYANWYLVNMIANIKNGTGSDMPADSDFFISQILDQKTWDMVCEVVLADGVATSAILNPCDGDNKHRCPAIPYEINEWRDFNLLRDNFVQHPNTHYTITV